MRRVPAQGLSYLVGTGAPPPLHGGRHLFAVAGVGRVLDWWDGLDHGGLHGGAGPLELGVPLGREIPFLGKRKGKAEGFAFFC